MSRMETEKRTTWVQHLTAVLSGSEAPLLRGRNEPAFLGLARTFRSLQEEDQNRFAAALAEIVQSLPVVPAAGPKWFNALELTALVKPLELRSFLRRLVFSGALRGLRYGGKSLHELGMAALAKYGVDDAFQDYLWRQARSTKDFPVLLRTLRLLGSEDGYASTTLLRQVLPMVKSDQQAVQLSVVLRELQELWGSRVLYQWYVEEAEVLLLQFPKSTERLMRILRERVFPWDARSELDGYGVLLSTRLRARKEAFGPDDVVEILERTRECNPKDIDATLACVSGALAEKEGMVIGWTVQDAGDLGNIFRSPPPGQGLCIGDTCSSVSNREAGILEAVSAQQLTEGL